MDAPKQPETGSSNQTPGHFAHIHSTSKGGLKTILADRQEDTERLAAFEKELLRLRVQKDNCRQDQDSSRWRTYQQDKHSGCLLRQICLPNQGFVGRLSNEANGLCAT
ncbi:hypothetical protein PSHT_14829 [Puccinia striiformis]|uniref:Uncharacterized protein n=1 Tax=Puccinia striiformis TaxID=27350 RepID=A0A2S4UI58_9BASI|nr:hypothetical protein PSHT_14829 [Puccinia striiformis]